VDPASAISDGHHHGVLLHAGADETGDDPPGASCPESGEVALDFLEPCDVPGRLGKIGPYEVIDVLGRGGSGDVSESPRGTNQDAFRDLMVFQRRCPHNLGAVV